jgi:hypothetical protein
MNNINIHFKAIKYLISNNNKMKFEEMKTSESALKKSRYEPLFGDHGSYSLGGEYFEEHRMFNSSINYMG